jgi:hypothetical protein
MRRLLEEMRKLYIERVAITVATSRGKRRTTGMEKGIQVSNV